MDQTTKTIQISSNAVLFSLVIAGAGFILGRGFLIHNSVGLKWMMSGNLPYQDEPWTGMATINEGGTN